ncbi:MAG TPA: hypothetical protein VMN03_13290 [Burkholderiales bacterium]|nr:hypothetical protein [Burkholderiales bacterium]
MIDVDVWVRGQQDATTRRIEGVPDDAAAWTDEDVKALLEQMLLALERAKNSGGDLPQISLRGFSWIVSSEGNGVLVHLEMQLGTASAGPFDIDEGRLTEMIARVMGGPKPSALVH